MKLAENEKRDAIKNEEPGGFIFHKRVAVLPHTI